MGRFEDICSLDTELTADSFEYVPGIKGPDGESLVTVATYQYRPETGDRQGRLYLMALPPDGIWKELDRLDTEGILNVEWTSASLGHLALSSGQVTTVAIEDGRLRKVAQVEIDSSSIVLSLDISFPSNTPVLCSTNKGSLSVIEGDTVTSQWQAHLCEAWTCAWDCHDPHLAYSGSDDYSWAGWDVRDPQKPAFLSTFHQAGVCAVASDPHRPFHLVTGSYDEVCALWDRRNLQQPLAQHQAGSGVWRLRWHPTAPGLLLAGCMHDGFHVWRLTDMFEALAHRPSASLAYGCDWIQTSHKDFLIGGATFYDHTAFISRVCL